jgi:quercetin dioxygenase-like cupin family protein
MDPQLAAGFLQALSETLAAESRAEPRLADFAGPVGQIKCETANYDRAEPLDHPVISFLEPALAVSSGWPALLAASHSLARLLRWYQIFQGTGPKPPFSDGMLAAQVAGNAGVFTSPEVRCGLFLLAPGLRYPSHTHAASEVYMCLSGQLEIEHGIGRKPFTLSPGKYSITPSNCIHSLSTRTDPVLLIYIWVGDVDAPNWIWERAAAGSWTRSQWTRQPDASWSKTSVEPVDAETLRLASRT